MPDLLTMQNVVVLFVLSVLAGVLAIAPTSARADVVPGGILTVPLPSGFSGATFGGRRVLIRGQTAVIGIGLDIKPGSHTLVFNGASGASQAARDFVFAVESKTYPEQRLQIANQKMVNPDPEALKRIEAEAKRMEAVYMSFTPGPPPTAFDKPLQGRISSPFGFRRVFNGEPRNPHSGLDIAAPTGTPVPSPAAGTVVLTGNFYFNGNSVFVDHSQGFITMVCHLSTIDVLDGQKINAGDILGKVGATGRATGPHLHWSVSLNGYRVEPDEAIRIFSSGK